MPPYTLGGREFPRKGDAVKHVRAVLNGTPLRATVTDPIIRALLDQHPYHDQKTAYGVAGIEVIPDDWGHRCFAIRTDDGTLIPFSFRECFKPSTIDQDGRAALRWEITPQIAEFRRSAALVCTLTGVPLTLARGRRDTAEVDHEPPATFLAISDAWIREIGGWHNLHQTQDGTHRHIPDPEQRAHWHTWHRQHARLRLLSAAAHRNVGGTA